jgi:aminopeptidase N
MSLCVSPLLSLGETALLIDPNATEAMSEQNVVATVAHELAHQWYADRHEHG